MSDVRPGMVRLDPSYGSTLTMILNKEPDATLGVGGYESVERPLRRAGRYFKSVPDSTIALDCTIDIDAIGGPSVERRLRVLQLMGLADAKHDEPPTIRLSGDVWDRLKTWDWVIQPQGITLGPRLWNSDGSLRRQQVTVSLERFDGIDEVEPIKIKSTRSGKGHKRRRHTVKTRTGDTLRSVSLRELGSATRWKDIQGWNKKKLKHVDPDARLRTGTKLSIH